MVERCGIGSEHSDNQSEREEGQPRAAAVNPSVQAIDPRAAAVNPSVQTINPSIAAMDPRDQTCDPSGYIAV